MDEKEPTHEEQPSTGQPWEQRKISTSKAARLRPVYISISILLLLCNYFLAQYDKFILSYFQDSVSESLNLSASAYGVISGYATGIVYALAALPVAYLADSFKSARVWVLTICSLWWSLCVIFQSLAHNFWQMFLARIAMGLGQACVEPLSVSLISDLTDGWRNVFVGESIFFVGVYIGEAISGQIATAFTDREEGWRVALRAIGITGIVVAVVLRLFLRDSTRNSGLIVDDKIYEERTAFGDSLQTARSQLRITVSYLIRMRSFWLLVLSASCRQLAGNVFGYYMPTYLSNTFPAKEEMLSRYGIIVGVVGTVAVLTGGAATSLLWERTKLTPLWITAIGGMISSVFVMLMLFSRQTANGDQTEGVHILYGVMSVAYLSAELWLGCMYGLIASLLPPRHKTFGLSIWSAIQVLIYSSGPQIIGLALRKSEPGSTSYTNDTRVLLAVLIVGGYWLAGLGFLSAIPLLRHDVEHGVDIAKKLSSRRKRMLTLFVVVLCSLVVALFVASIVYAVV
ncbi:hypothetical protein LTR37_006386 [Vermiconidia calcicola]|uniref:Uncharacterized protein n=1 Tax=Vermiconidia calcicola TaxID=1690605 RepID=A0ACC3NJA0_9PEZI|nr:hypothetical protein LTR37_006386 [Vermiconidia calcicola]